MEQGLTASLQGLFDEYGIGIQIMDSATGEMESTYNILAAMAEKWDSLTDAQRQNLGETAAGKNRITEFNALMSGFNRTLEATEAAYESAGITAQQYAVYQDSIEGKLNSLKEAWQELVTEGGTINKFIKFVLDAGTAVLKFADSDIGQLIIKTTALTVGFKLLSNPVTKLFGLIKGSPFGTFIKILSTAGVNANTLQFAFTALNDVMIANPLFWGAAIFAGFGLLEYLTSTERQIKKLGETLDENTAQLQDYFAEIEELESKEGSLTSAEQARLQWLKDQTAELEKQNQEIVEQIDLEQNRQTDERGYGTTKGGGLGIAGGTAVNYQQIDDTSAIERAKQNLEEAKSIEDLTEATQDFVKSKIDLAKQAEDSGAAISEETQEILDLYNSLHDVSDATQDTSDSVSTTAQEFSNLADSEGSVVDTTRQVLNSLAEENSQMISNWNSMQDLVAAETQLRNGQKLSETQIQQLIAKYPALRSQIDAMRNGELAAANAIHAVGVQSLGTSKTVIANSKAEADAAVKSAEQVVASERAKYLAYVKTLDAAKDSSAHAQAERDRAASDFSAALAQLREAKAAQAMYSQAVYYGTEVIAGNTGATSTNTSATEKNTDAIRESTQALKDQTDAIKNAADYMVDKIDEQIDTLEDSKDAINKYYDDWIERLQDTNSELEDQIELENALQKLAEAKSKKVRVYRDGGFAYVSDTQAVAEAQREASTLQRQKEQEDLIAQLEKAREKDLASVDKQIDAWEKEKQTWEDASKSYDNYLATQALGIDQEGKNWSKRLGQAKTYTSDYLKLMQAIDDVESGRKTPAQGQQVVTSVSSDIRNLPTSTSALKGQINTSSPISAYTPVENVIRTDTSGNTVINVANITLPNVENPTDFIADLQDFARYASQSAGNR